ncbi:hypothetical protein ACKRZS_007888 [Fusarium odoratissimum]|uniref:DUF7702 domain-containing protein n=1 Tax=Fusarium odoratissimum (strain NRRL 54006) TaxID=1089451 RepID=X0JNY2_FUSO5|nr:uncharacterized protein FOIG_09594 [Fusarium odoratissimum NRRL 54006]EXL98035.1 hypothetical protein FOIG_09594 [Fusarium odoratissimum NRRL 54006]
MERSFQLRDGIAAAQVPIFAVFFLFGIFFGIRKKDGWISVALFSSIRIAGASCLLAAFTTGSSSVWAAASVLESLGLVLLMFVLLGLLKRTLVPSHTTISRQLCQLTQGPHRNAHLQVLTDWHFRIPELICWAGVGVSVADYIGGRYREDLMAPSSLSRVSVGLFAALFAWTALLFLRLVRKWNLLSTTQRRCMIGVGAALPFMTARTIHSLIYTITAKETFSSVSGSGVIYLFMTMLPEVGVLASVVWAMMGLPSERRETRESVPRSSEDEVDLHNLIDSNATRRAP